MPVSKSLLTFMLVIHAFGFEVPSVKCCVHPAATHHKSKGGKAIEFNPFQLAHTCGTENSYDHLPHLETRIARSKREKGLAVPVHR